MPSLPLELVHEIVSYACTPTDETASKATWHSIYPLAIASRAYRGIALEGWFRVLRSGSPHDLCFLEDYFPQIFTLWTRELHVSPSHEFYSAWDLRLFHRLHLVRFNHPPLPNRQASVLQVFANTPPNIVELDLRHLLWPRPDVFFAVAAVFPALEVLRTTQRWSWCGLCNTCSKVELAGAVPPKLVYTDGFGLPIHYARALSPLVHLHTVTITVPYTEGAHIALDSKDLWAGECDSCVEMLYGDPDFLDKWSARKRGVVTSGEDESRKAYIKPPSLRIVEWVLQRSEGPAEEIVDEEFDSEEDFGSEQEEA